MYSTMNLERAAKFVLMMAVGASANRRNGTASSTTPIPAIQSDHTPDDKFVVDLTRDSFNQSVANGSHFVMFYDPT